MLFLIAPNIIIIGIKRTGIIIKRAFCRLIIFKGINDSTVRIAGSGSYGKLLEFGNSKITLFNRLNAMYTCDIAPSTNLAIVLLILFRCEYDTKNLVLERLFVPLPIKILVRLGYGCNKALKEWKRPFTIRTYQNTISRPPLFFSCVSIILLLKIILMFTLAYIKLNSQKFLVRIITYILYANNISTIREYYGLKSQPKAKESKK